jgi:hypothetical protein
MSELTTTLHGSITDLEGYKAAGERMRAHVNEHEPGVTRYDWYVSTDRSSFLNVDVFASSEVFLEHMGAAQERGDLDAFMGSIDVTRVEVLGSPSEGAKAALDGFGAIYLDLEGGLES